MTKINVFTTYYYYSYPIQSNPISCYVALTLDQVQVAAENLINLKYVASHLPEASMFALYSVCDSSIFLLGKFPFGHL